MITVATLSLVEDLLHLLDKGLVPQRLLDRSALPGSFLKRREVFDSKGLFNSIWAQEKRFAVHWGMDITLIPAGHPSLKSPSAPLRPRPGYHDLSIEDKLHRRAGSPGLSRDPVSRE